MNATPAPRTDTKITFTGAFTCAHHNDQQRAACPVCLVSALTAERDQLRAEVEALKQSIESGQRVLREDAEQNAKRAERAEAAETVALAHWNGALERALKAEADLAALEQCHDDNCRAVVKIAAELATMKEGAK